MLKRILLGAFAAASISAPALAQDTLRTGKSVSFSWTFVPAEVCMESGVCAKHNIKLVISSFAGDARMQQALTADSIDIGIGSGPGLGFMAKGVPAKGIAAMANEPRNMAMVVSAESPVKSLDDLKIGRAHV